MITVSFIRARYYNVDYRRFINADIIAGNISNAVTLNRYAYANGNPAVYIDPTGLLVGELLLLGGLLLATAFLSGCSSNSTTVIGNDTNTVIDTEDFSWADTEPGLQNGRYHSVEEALQGNYDRILYDAQNGKEETGYVLYYLHGGYYVGTGQGGVHATDSSVDIDKTDIPPGATVVAIIHTHRVHKEGSELLYRPSEYSDVVKNNFSSYVIDNDGCVFVLQPESKNHLDYQTLYTDPKVHSENYRQGRK